MLLGLAVRSSLQNRDEWAAAGSVGPGEIVWLFEWYVTTLPTLPSEISATENALRLLLQLRSDDIARGTFSLLLKGGSDKFCPTQEEWNSALLCGRSILFNDFDNILSEYCPFAVLRYVVTHCSAEAVREYVRNHPDRVNLCLFYAHHEHAPLLVQLGAVPSID